MKDRVLVERTKWVTRIWQFGEFSIALVIGLYALTGGADSWAVNLGWLLVAGAFVVFGVRAGRTALIATDAGLLVRNVAYSRRVPWTEARVRFRHSLPKQLGAWSLIINEASAAMKSAAAAGMTRDEIEEAAERVKAEIEARCQHAHRS